MRTTSTALAALLASVAALGAFGGTAAADRTRNRLDKEPAVRHRLLLLKGRFEVQPLFETSINADFRHTIGGGLKLEYHLSDMLSFGAIGVFGTSINTGLVDKIVDTLESEGSCVDPMGMSVDCDATREPSKEEFLQHLNKIPVHGAAYVSLTPWYGKLAAFSTAFVNFDFYFQGGVAFAQLKSDCDEVNICDDPAPGQTTPNPQNPDLPFPPDDNPNNDRPLNSGTKVGLYLAGGLHVFLNDFIALDFSVRDYAFTDNPSGADYNADLFVCDGSGGFDCKSDSRFLHHIFAGFGVSIMFPMTAKRTK
jgi:outer membrane beta-barrel protein